ncbi:HPP family protein [Bradyrhizobium lablabi]|uniref:HPP family protein n=1 Tax=Bradyrhizobium lablabi TaxID=722472 RepID=UPI001BAC6070|nr:HPP family protein [Bradyrhizobium lablabi]MBR0694070.1 hypothetical protein [Bradyrhizobium lablabi]
MKYTTRLFAEFLALTFVGGIGLAVDATGISLILFPEIAALAYDVFTRPRGKWASQPIRLIATPTITAILGVMITRHWEYSALAVTVVALLSLLAIELLRSNIGAAISAGVLPMTLGVMSWVYPAAILAGLAVLAIALTLWKRLDPHRYLSEGSKESRIIETAETPPRGRFWIFALTAFVFALGAVAQTTGLRFLLFPPLIVVAYELFGHPDLPGWMSRPVLFPLVCFLTASVGLLLSTSFHTEFLGVTVTMLCSIAILRVFKVHMPPALAVGLIPFVIVHPTFWYPISVFLGAAALITSTRAYSFITHQSAT